MTSCRAVLSVIAAFQTDVRHSVQHSGSNTRVGAGVPGGELRAIVRRRKRRCDGDESGTTGGASGGLVGRTQRDYTDADCSDEHRRADSDRHHTAFGAGFARGMGGAGPLLARH